MKQYEKKETYTIYNGSMLDISKVIDNNSIDSIITDPPYELGFMNKSWDSSGIAFQPKTWKQCYNALKPGGYLLAFGGSRTFHRIAVAIEDAGFEIRDTIMWLYGAGFPKSHNIGLSVDKKMGIESKVVGKQFNIANKKINPTGRYNWNTESQKSKDYIEIKQAQNDWQGWGTALKPSYEPIIVARKPIEKTVAENVMKYGVGGINIDECRVDADDQEKLTKSREYFGKSDIHKKTNSGAKFLGSEKIIPNMTSGRFPANTILTYDETDFEEVCGNMPDGSKNGSIAKPYKINNQVYGEYGNCKEFEAYNDSGNACRYFYTAKASKKDRDEGLEIASQKVNDGRKTEIDNPFQRGETLRKNNHPTVKPTELMQYLVRLVSPKGATILDCFMGSGSTGKAVMFENRERDANYKFIGIDLEEEYCEIASARIDYALNKYEYDFNQELEIAKEQGQLNIFDLIERE